MLNKQGLTFPNKKASTFPNKKAPTFLNKKATTFFNKKACTFFNKKVLIRKLAPALEEMLIRTPRPPFRGRGTPKLKETSP